MFSLDIVAHRETNPNAHNPTLRSYVSLGLFYFQQKTHKNSDKWQARLPILKAIGQSLFVINLLVMKPKTELMCRRSSQQKTKRNR